MVDHNPVTKACSFITTIGSDIRINLASDYQVSSNDGVYDAQKGAADSVDVDSASPKKSTIVYPGQLPIASYQCDANDISLDNVTTQDLTVTAGGESDSIVAGASECIDELPSKLMLFNQGKPKGSIGLIWAFSGST